MIDKIVTIFDDFTKGERMQDLAQLAKENNIPFKKKVSFGIQSTAIKGFKLFTGKGTKRLIGLLTPSVGNFEGKIRFYDYLVTKDLETKTHSVIEVSMPGLYTDYFMIEPKGAISKMKSIFVTHPLIFPELKDFHAKFEVHSEEADDTSILKKSILSLMTEYPGLTCEAMDNQLIFYYKKKTIEVQRVLPMIHFAIEFVRLLCYDNSDDFV